jgi:hypothetical protein
MEPFTTMDQQPPQAPAYQPPANQTIAPAPQGKNKRKILALWLLIGPTALIVGSIILFAIINFALSGTNNEGLTTFRAILNIFMFLAGAISVLTWLPGIIAGIVLLATEKKS